MTRRTDALEAVLLPDELIIWYEYSATTQAQALTEIPELRPIFKYWWPITLASLGVMFLINAPYRSLFDFLLLFALMSPVTASMLLLPYLVKRSALKRARRLGAGRTDLFEVRSFGPEGVLSLPAWSEPVPWSFITKVVESEHFFFIYHAGGHHEHVPKSVMTDAQMNELRAMLRSRLSAATAQLKLFPGTP